jgi:hypothetical protein
MLLGADFPICTAQEYQSFPVVEYASGMFYVFWLDHRQYPLKQLYAIYGARVTPDGHVIDPDGKLVYCDSASGQFDVAFDGSNFLVTCRNGC